MKWLLAAVPALSLLAACDDAAPRAQADDPAPAAPQGPPGGPSGLSANLPPALDTVLLVAGDIASCDNDRDERTAEILDTLPGTVLTLGDNVYQVGTLARYRACYGPSWGRHRYRTRPAVGDHDWHTHEGQDYFAWFGEAAGPPGLGYYVLQAGSWRVYVLNSELDLERGSAQHAWLESALQADRGRCQVAALHVPRFSTGGDHGSTQDEDIMAAWRLLHQHRVELMLSGDDHIYERFRPMDPEGRLRPDDGVVQMVVGTGGMLGDTLNDTPERHSVVRAAGIAGVLRLSLADSSWAWRFIAAGDEDFLDEGSAACH